MKKSIFLIILIITCFIIPLISGNCSYISDNLGIDENQPDTLQENQILYNGRIWNNLYYMVEDDQFLFSPQFLPSSLTMNGKTFDNIPIKYDIFKDEILTPVHEGVLQLNKEMVDSFIFDYQKRRYRFAVMPESREGLGGYVNVLCKGKTSLYVKYTKKIDRPGVEGKNDKFYQLSRIYIMKDSFPYQITNKKDVFEIYAKDKLLIKDFVKKNKLQLSKKNPESFIPVVSYYNSINQ